MTEKHHPSAICAPASGAGGGAGLKPTEGGDRRGWWRGVERQGVQACGRDGDTLAVAEGGATPSILPRQPVVVLGIRRNAAPGPAPPGDSRTRHTFPDARLAVLPDDQTTISDEKWSASPRSHAVGPGR